MVLTPPVTRCRVSSVCVPVVSSVWSWVSVCGVLTTVRSRGSWVSGSRVRGSGGANSWLVAVTPNRFLVIILTSKFRTLDYINHVPLCLKRSCTVPCGPGRLYSLLYSYTAEKGRGPPTVRPKLPIRESLRRTSKQRHPGIRSLTPIMRHTRLTGRGSTSALRIASAGLQIDRMRNLLSRWRELQHAGTSCAHALLTDQLLAE